MKQETRTLYAGILLMVFFGIWTALIQMVDVRSVGQAGTDVGFAGLNVWFHELTGVHMKLYIITDWFGLVPIFVCLFFGGIGMIQLVRRRRLMRVDRDLLLLGMYYMLVVLVYLIFEMIPINFRPVFIEGRLEASYPSSTTLLVLSVMPTLVFQANRRLKKRSVRKAIHGLTTFFSVFMVVGRLISGVHWLTDVIGAVLLSMGMFLIYKGASFLCERQT